MKNSRKVDEEDSAIRAELIKKFFVRIGSNLGADFSHTDTNKTGCDHPQDALELLHATEKEILKIIKEL